MWNARNAARLEKAEATRDGNDPIVRISDANSGRSGSEKTNSTQPENAGYRGEKARIETEANIGAMTNPMRPMS